MIGEVMFWELMAPFVPMVWVRPVLGFLGLDGPEIAR